MKLLPPVPDPVDRVSSPIKVYRCVSMCETSVNFKLMTKECVCFCFLQVCVRICVFCIINLLPCCTILSPFSKVTAAFTDADARRGIKSTLKHFIMDGCVHPVWLTVRTTIRITFFLLYSFIIPIVITTYFNVTRPSAHWKWQGKLTCLSNT